MSLELYFHSINTAARVKFLGNGCNFSLSGGSRRLFDVGLIVISLTTIWNYNNAVYCLTKSFMLLSPEDKIKENCD